MDPQQPERLLLGLTDVLECQDAGADEPSWSSVSKGLPDDTFVVALAIAPSAGKTVYAATYDGHVWTTTDGKSWAANDTGFQKDHAGHMKDIRVDPKNPRRAFGVSTGWGGLCIWSLDPTTGRWSPICGDMPSNLSMATIAVDWRTTVLYVGTDRGVYRSTDLGAHWERFGEGLPNVPVTDLKIHAESHILAAGTYGRGMWQILLPPPGTSAAAPAAPSAKEAAVPDPARAQARRPYALVSDLTLRPGLGPGQPIEEPWTKEP